MGLRQARDDSSGRVNGASLTLFFFVVALELKRELVFGELRDLRRAALPFAGALGGMIVPASLYLAIMNGQPGAHGWGTVMATDTAFVVGCLGLFGSRIPSSPKFWKRKRIFCCFSIACDEKWKSVLSTSLRRETLRILRSLYLICAIAA